MEGQDNNFKHYSDSIKRSLVKNIKHILQVNIKFGWSQEIIWLMF